MYALATGLAFIHVVLGLLLNTSLWILWIRLSYHSSREIGEEVRGR